MYRAYRHMGDVWSVQIYRGHTDDVWGTDIWEDVQIMGPYRHMEDVWWHTNIQVVQMYGCVYRCMGEVLMYGSVQMYGPYRHMGMYGGVQTYRGLYRCMGDVQRYGLYMCGRLYRHPPNHRQTRHTPPHLPTTLEYYISYKICLSLLAYQLVLQHSNT